MTNKDMSLKLWSVSLTTFLLVQSVAAQTSLFSFNEPIAQLTLSNFSSVIPNSPKIWIVNFYSAWCGHCQRMAPEFSAVARNIQGWSDVVGMAAVACSDPANSALCRNYGITGYPMIRFFPPNSESSFHGHRYEGDKYAEGLRIGIVEYLSQIISQGRSDRTWPRLDSIRHPQELWRSNGVRQVFIVVEDEAMSAKYVGLMVILDSLRMRPDVVVGRMSFQEAELYGVTSPGLYQSTAFGGLHETTRDVSSESIASAIREAAGQGTTGMERNNVGESVVPKPTWTNEHGYTPPKGLHMQDLESSLYYSLWVEIPSRVAFNNESLAALKSYIHILTKYHPGEAHVKNFLSQLNQWLSFQRDSLSTQSWLQELQSIQSKDAYIRESLRWTGCNGSLPHLRGYPCSLWMTFHAVTVSAYVKEIANMSFDAHDVLIPIRDYIHHFLSCRECAANFGRRARHLDTIQLEPRDVVLWLWKSHNRANFHLHGDTTEDPLYPKLQFPSYKACPSCRIEAAAGLRFNVSEDAWREDRVLTYLLGYYGEEFIFDDDVEGMSRGSSSAEDHVTGSPAASCPSSSYSDWTPCSRSCDVGLSMRMTQSQAFGCQLQPEVRLCLIRPCSTQFPNWTQSARQVASCPRYGHTYVLAKPFLMSYGNCSLIAAEAWRVCGLCPSNRNGRICCLPQRSSTKMREAACLVRSEGEVRRVLGSIPVEVIDFCRCDKCSP